MGQPIVLHVPIKTNIEKLNRQGARWNYSGTTHKLIYYCQLTNLICTNVQQPILNCMIIKMISRFETNNYLDSEYNLNTASSYIILSRADLGYIYYNISSL